MYFFFKYYCCALTDRDVVKYLTDIRISNIQDFDWISQLRYYWKVNDSKWPCFGNTE